MSEEKELSDDLINKEYFKLGKRFCYLSEKYFEPFILSGIKFKNFNIIIQEMLFIINRCKELLQPFQKNNNKIDNNVRNSNEYKEWRNKVFLRDNYICQECGSKNNLQAHHKIFVSEDNNKIFDIDNGITLCIDCHAEKHSEVEDLILSKKKNKILYKKVINNVEYIKNENGFKIINNGKVKIDLNKFKELYSYE
ncbi:MAG: HNH endonuclease [Promethearchaeota archaeon]